MLKGVQSPAFQESSMSRILSPFFAILVALGCVVIGSTVALSNIAVTSGVPAYVTKADFDRAFADAAAGQRDTTPTVREKYRNASWSFFQASR
jgi:hypothetical protein